jgi:fimbrial chaperone protein
MMRLPPCRRAVIALTAVACLLASSGLAAKAQSLAVLPVNIFLSPGENATALTVTNHGESATSIQIRAYAWSQKGDEDQLTPTDAVVVSPPLATIASGATQVVRLILRRPAQGQEETYRILIDQIPPPAEPGVVHVVLRLSIPIFAKPATRAVPDLQFHVEREGEQLFLVGINNGLCHESIRNIVLTTGDGHQWKARTSVSPYILAGDTRRWPIATEGTLPEQGDSFRLTAHADTGAIDQQVRLVAAP